MPYSTTRPSPYRGLQAWARSLDIGFHPMMGGLMLILFGFHLLTFQEEHWWGDSYQYLLHAENVLSGQTYADTGYVPSPHNFIAPAAYPPGYPLLIAPLLALFGASPQVFAMLASLFLLGTAWATATLARGWIPDPYAIAIAVLIGLQPWLIAMSRQPLSDPSFLFFAMLCVLAADRASYRQDTWNRRVVVAGLALGAAALIRTLGLVLIPALLLPGLIRHRRLSRSALAATGLGFGIWLLVSLIPLGAPALSGTTASSGGYGALIQDDLFHNLLEIPARIPLRIVDYARATFPFWEVPGRDVLKNVLFLGALFPVGLGLIHRIRRRLGPAETFAALYLLSLLPWTFSSTRYLSPLYPLYYLYLVVGAWRIGRDGLGRMWATNAVLVSAIGLSYGTRYLEWVVGPPTQVVPREDASLYQFVRATIPDSAVVVTSHDPRPTVYHTRRRASVGPDTIEEWNAYADRIGATYALVRDESEIAPEVLRDPRHQLVRRDGDLTLYHVCPTACVRAPEP